MQQSPAGRLPVSTEADWRRLVEKSLGGRLPASLHTGIEPGLAIDPLIPGGTLPPLWSRNGLPWLKLHRLDRLDADAVAVALAAGADGFEIVLEGAVPAYRGGIPIDRLDECLALLPVDRCRLRLAAGDHEQAVDAALERIVARRRLDPALLQLAFGFDPIGAAAGSGSGIADWDARGRAIAVRVARLIARGWRGPFLAADGRIVHAAGGAASTELAYALGAFLAYLRPLLDTGIADADAVAAVDVALAADEDQFVTIAKFRALRLLQAGLLAAAGLPAMPLALHGETSWRMLAAEDMRSNLIRSSIAALAAAIGGADSLSVLPFTAASGTADQEGARLALTTQAILLDEARLARVADPGAGSGTIERLTFDLAEAGWARFQQIERDGGLPSALATGRLQAEIAAEAARRQAEIAGGRRGIVGVTLFRADGTTVTEAAPPAGPAAALRPGRDAAPFERPAS